jgi:hypothetical protein
MRSNSVPSTFLSLNLSAALAGWEVALVVAGLILALLRPGRVQGRG